jgi:hypothetical protein
MQRSHAGHARQQVVNRPSSATRIAVIIVGPEKVIDNLEKVQAEAFGRTVERAAQFEPHDLLKDQVLLSISAVSDDLRVQRKDIGHGRRLAHAADAGDGEASRVRRGKDFPVRLRLNRCNPFIRL